MIVNRDLLKNVKNAFGINWTTRMTVPCFCCRPHIHAVHERAQPADVQEDRRHGPDV